MYNSAFDVNFDTYFLLMFINFCELHYEYV